MRVQLNEGAWYEISKDNKLTVEVDLDFEQNINKDGLIRVIHAQGLLQRELDGAMQTTPLWWQLHIRHAKARELPRKKLGKVEKGFKKQP